MLQSELMRRYIVLLVVVALAATVIVGLTTSDCEIGNDNEGPVTTPIPTMSPAERIRSLEQQWSLLDRKVGKLENRIAELETALK